MSVKTINKGDMPAFVSSAMGQFAVYGPVARETERGFMFAPIKAAAQLRLDYTTTILPPRKFLLPQEETLFTFQTDGMSATPAFDMQWRALFGVHTCDLHAMALLDDVFTKGQPDAHYIKRRSTTLVVSVECLAPCDDQSFCKSMNTLTANFGYDLHLTDIGDFYAVDVGTAAGEALLTNHARSHDATQAEMAALDKALSAKWGRFPLKLDVDAKELPALMGVSQRDPLWDELGSKCLSCGACNLVCPTCYCFDVHDHVTLDGKSGSRARTWDSCQLDEFARVGTGENFRKTRAKRLLHRFNRKGKFIADSYGRTGCVGCGRCARACLVNITPTGVWNSLHKAHAV